MFNYPNMYPNPYGNNPMFNGGQGNHQDHQQVLNAVLTSIEGKASAVDFYSRLAAFAPNQKHKSELLRTLEEEEGHLKHFTDLYVTLTGNPPMYDLQPITFNSYSEGLQKAYEAGVHNYEEYREGYELTQHLPIREVFMRACNDEVDQVERLTKLSSNEERIDLDDYGTQPFVVDIEEASKQNTTFRTAIWTGDHLQVTVMSIDVGDDIGLEVHPDVDQFLRIEEGEGLVQMGDSKDQLDFEAPVYDDYAIMVPAGKWHNLTNTGDEPLKLYTIYAPPEHPFGTVHETKADAMEAE
ncbi:cupin domain-containing protein [Halobacillus sp. Marseille-Q1614]|uniref:cupin domain-containing protein n=1 Tax=Halobacillus sp. Marseille-Q1614 TaxID=2709134 RepID=UPI0020C27055|nr:cupin domain-containing protein [Halobacillus sp. Marseille-Q1614]